MAKVAAVAWFPRSYIHLFETYIGLGKADLKIEDVRYDKSLTFTIKSYKDYPAIRFTQEWSGLHCFTVELPDKGVEESADMFMKEMQILLLQRILKACHSVTYKQIVADLMPLDFHVIVLTKGDVKLDGFVVKEAGGLKVAYKPEEFYYSGTISYVLGSDDLSLLKVLLYHAYTEVAFDFLYSMMKAMIRLYHEADNIVGEMEAARDPKGMREPMKLMDDIMKECSERYGKLKQVILNFRLKEEEFRGVDFSQQERALAEALEIRDSFRRLQADGAYMDILWGDILEDRLRSVDSTLDARVMMYSGGRKGWF